MKIEIKQVSADEDWPLFQEVRRNIVSLYNQSSRFHQEEPALAHLDLPSLVHALYLEQQKGGVLLEQFTNDPKHALITFAALDESVRGQGIARELIGLAHDFARENGFEIIGVQVNDFDSHKVWNKLGFKEPVKTNSGVIVLLKDGM